MSQLKNLKWTPEEEKTLKELREIQIKNNVVDWQQISNILNQTFPKAIRTSKQCRQKYVNHARLQGSGNHSNWTQQELQSLITLYEEVGPSWSYISTKLVNKSQNSLKNKFNNGLRRISKLLYSKQGELYKHTKKSISTQMLIAMIDFVNQLQKSIFQNDFTINLQSKFFSFTSQILRFSLLNYQVSSDEISNLVRKIKALNCKIRCFGIFKVKNRKNWKLSKKGLLAVCRHDKIINQQIMFIEEKSDTMRKTEVCTLTSFVSDQKQDSCMNEFNNQFEQFNKSYYNLDHRRLEEQIKDIIGEQSQIIEFGNELFY